MKLKPCPFCGSKKRIITYGNCVCYFVISCCKCSASVMGETFEESQKLWNRRT